MVEAGSQPNWCRPPPTGSSRNLINRFDRSIAVSEDLETMASLGCGSTDRLGVWARMISWPGIDRFDRGVQASLLRGGGSMDDRSSQQAFGRRAQRKQQQRRLAHPIRSHLHTHHSGLEDSPVDPTTPTHNNTGLVSRPWQEALQDPPPDSGEGCARSLPTKLGAVARSPLSCWRRRRRDPCCSHGVHP